MDHHFSIEDRGQVNPRQAEVDRTRDAAARSLKAKAGSAPTVTTDDVSIRPADTTPSTADSD
ncbi:MAG: hypothetical protein JWL60_2363 [Gemmatimonadetes bacterium]|jgi:hypothetical protein|nr:hypothetical protein [Gemmatimonadota bacterium]